MPLHRDGVNAVIGPRLGAAPRAGTKFQALICREAIGRVSIVPRYSRYAVSREAHPIELRGQELFSVPTDLTQYAAAREQMVS
jgi:hypothetical protein